jgi:hypothetical protein
MIRILRFKILRITKVALKIIIFLQIFIVQRFHPRKRVKVWIVLRICFRLIIPYLFKYIILQHLFTILLWFDFIAEIKLGFNFLVEVHLIELRLKFLWLNRIAEKILRLLLFWYISFKKIVCERIRINWFCFNFYRNVYRLRYQLNVNRLRG